MFANLINKKIWHASQFHAIFTRTKRETFIVTECHRSIAGDTYTFKLIESDPLLISLPDLQSTY